MTTTSKKKKARKASSLPGLGQLLDVIRVLGNYMGTILIDTARRSEAWAPAQQQAQVEFANTVGALSHAMTDDVKPRVRRRSEGRRQRSGGRSGQRDRVPDDTFVQ